MLEYKIILGFLAGSLTLIAHLPYFFDIFKKRTRPHIFSWGIWTALLLIGLTAQLVKGAGFGGWSTAGDAIACFFVVVLCFWYGTKDITSSDQVSFGFGLLGVVLWVVTNNPLWAVIFVVIADGFGFFPTFRKSFLKPYEETPLTFFLVAVGYVVGLLALESYSLTTIIYPVYLILANGSFFLYIIIRRAQLRHHA